MANIYQTAREFKASLLRKEQVASKQILDAYLTSWNQIKASSDALLIEIQKAKQKGETVSRSWLIQQNRLDSLQAQVGEQIGYFARNVHGIITAEQQRATDMALFHSRQLVLEGLEQIQISAWKRVPTQTVEHLIGTLQNGSPLLSLLQSLGIDAKKSVSDSLIVGLVAGKPLDAIARQIRDSVGISLVRAKRISRTEILRSYREASILSYKSNSDLVDGWIWLASLSSRTCASCLAMHGSKHSLDEQFGSHVNCRCTPIPSIIGDQEEIEGGEDWFARQNEETQANILADSGKGAFDAYKNGDVRLSDFVKIKDDPNWGTSRTAGSLEFALAQTEKRKIYQKRKTDTQIQDTLKVEAGADELAQKVFDVINEIHNIEGISNTVFRVVELEGLHGSYNYSENVISINTDTNIPLLTSAHEIAHLLDHRHLSVKNGFGKIERPFDEASYYAVAKEKGLLLGWLNAVTESVTVKMLHEARHATETKEERDTLEYYLSVYELWARSYEQFIGTLSTNPEVKRELKIIKEDYIAINDELLFTYWSRTDFEPIMKEIRKLFRELGWR